MTDVVTVYVPLPVTVVQVQVPGIEGPKGDQGTVWRSGTGAPAGGLGLVGDWYLNDANGDVYEKTGTSTWTLRDNLTGPIGPTGQAEQWLNGAGAPAGGLGSVGDMYLNTSNGDVYEKTGVSTWTLRANIIGPQGAPGTGDVVGPASATDKAIARFNGATGKLIQNSAATLDNNGKLIAPAGAAGTASINLPHGSAPSAPVDGDVWTTSAAMFMRLNGVTQTNMTLAGGTMTGIIITLASAIGGAGFRLPAGVVPTSPVNGDLWTTSTLIQVRLNGVTQTIMTLAGGAMTGLITTLASAAGGAGLNLPHGAAPTSPVNGDFWTTITGFFMRINGVTQQNMTLAGGVMTGEITTVASAAGTAGFNVPHGAAPTSPANGDMWTTVAALFVRINGVTQQVASLIDTTTEIGINTQTANYTLVLADAGKLIRMNVASANTLTIPANASVAFPIGTKIDLVQYGAGKTSVAITTDTLRSLNSVLGLAGQYAGATLVKMASTEWLLVGNLG